MDTEVEVVITRLTPTVPDRKDILFTVGPSTSVPPSYKEREHSSTIANVIDLTRRGSVEPRSPSRDSLPAID